MAIIISKWLLFTKIFNCALLIPDIGKITAFAKQHFKLLTQY